MKRKECVYKAHSRLPSHSRLRLSEIFIVEEGILYSKPQQLRSPETLVSLPLIPTPFPAGIQTFTAQASFATRYNTHYQDCSCREDQGTLTLRSSPLYYLAELVR